MENKIEWDKVKSSNERLIKEFIENFNNASTLNSKVRSELELMLAITGCKTKEDLIRYIVCDGEPADESCVGHPILVHDKYDTIFDKPKQEYILISITENGFFVCGTKINAECVRYIAKKKPNYDYTQPTGGK